MSKYKTKKELKSFRETDLFTVSKGDYAEFYYVPLQGLELLSMVSIKHLLLVIRSKHNSDKIMSMGFYPADGNILGALFSPKDGFLWSPDPHFIPDTLGFEPAYYYGGNEPLVYKIRTKQAKMINAVLGDSNCRLKDGSKSRGLVKRDRLECPIEQYKYCPLPRKGSKNCVTWLHQVFPKLNTDINGTFNQLLDDLHVAGGGN